MPRLHNLAGEFMITLRQVNQISMLLVLLSLCFLVGCSTIQSKWSQASQQNTISAYEGFLAKYTNSSYDSQAHERLNELYALRDYNTANKANTIDAYSKFLEKYPNSKQASEAKQNLNNLLEKKDWEETKILNTKESYQSFKSRFPSSSFTHVADSLLANIDWDAIGKNSTIDEIETYIANYPQSSHLDKAKKKLKYLSMPPIIKAAADDDLEKVKALIKEGADVNIDADGITSLMYATSNGNFEMIKALVTHGAEINKIFGSFSPINLADKGNYEKDNSHYKPDVVEYLINTALTKKGYKSPTLKDIRNLAWNVGNDNKWNSGGGIGIELISATRDSNDLKSIILTGEMASWNSVAMYHIGTWEIVIRPDGDKWQATGKRIDSK